MKYLAPILLSIPPGILLAPALAQDPPTRPPSGEPPTGQAPVAPVPRPAPGQQLPAELFFDGVVAAVGSDVILRSDLDVHILRDQEHYGKLFARLQAEERRTGRPNPKAQAALFFDVLAEQAQQKLMVLGGQDQGYAPEMVQAAVERIWRKQIEYKGGYAATSRWLAEGGTTPKQYRQQVQDYLLSQSWLRSQTGENPGPTGRVEVDRYTRPGLMYSAYGAFRDSENAAERALVGALPERVVLQELILRVSEWNGLESTLDLARGLRQSASSRGAFEDLVANYSARGENAGLTSEREVEDLVSACAIRLGNDDLASFVRVAAVDTVSQPVASRDDGAGPQAVYLYRMDQRLPKESVRPFVDLKVQQSIRRNLELTLDRRRAGERLAALERAYFIWPEELRLALLARGLVSSR